MLCGAETWLLSQTVQPGASFSDLLAAYEAERARHSGFARDDRAEVKAGASQRQPRPSISLHALEVDYVRSRGRPLAGPSSVFAGRAGVAAAVAGAAAMAAAVAGAGDAAGEDAAAAQIVAAAAAAAAAEAAAAEAAQGEPVYSFARLARNEPDHQTVWSASQLLHLPPAGSGGAAAGSAAAVPGLAFAAGPARAGHHRRSVDGLPPGVASMLSLQRARKQQQVAQQRRQQQQREAVKRAHVHEEKCGVCLVRFSLLVPILSSPSRDHRVCAGSLVQELFVQYRVLTDVQDPEVRKASLLDTLVLFLHLRSLACRAVLLCCS